MGKGTIVDILTRAVVGNSLENHWQDVPYGLYKVILKPNYYTVSGQRGVDIHPTLSESTLRERTIIGIYHTRGQLGDEDIFLQLVGSLSITIPHETVDSIERIAHVPWIKGTHK